MIDIDPTIGSDESKPDPKLFSEKFQAKFEALNALKKAAALSQKSPQHSIEGQSGPSVENSEVRDRTPLRMQYSSEAAVIRRKLGGVEDIRKSLGLSRRQMCKLLMVDPSSWTRWAKDEERVPPHVYRALQWYLSLIDKDASWHPHNRFGLVQPLLDAKDIKSRLDRLEAHQWQAARPDTVRETQTSSRLLDERQRGGYWMAFLIIIGLAMVVGFFLGTHF